MESKNFTLKTKIKFLGNTGSFDIQPIVNLFGSNSLTGGTFLSLYRQKQTNIESASLTAIPDHSLDGVMSITYGDGIGLTSLTSDKRIRCSSVTSMSDLDYAIVTTGYASNLTFTIVSDKENDMNIFVEEEGVVTELFKMYDFGYNNPFYNYIGYGIRPAPEGLLDSLNDQTIPPNGTLASSLVLQYQYNAMERTQEFSTSGLTGVYDWSGNSNSASIFGQGAGDMVNFDIDNAVSGTVTGHTAGANEGGFRFEGNTYIKTTNPSVANLFNVRDLSTSGITLMTYVKFNATGNTDVITLHDGVDTMASLKVDRGCIVFESGTNSVSAGYIDIIGNPAVTAGTQLTKWMHVAATMNSTPGSSEVGTKLYINGFSTTLAGSEESISADMYSIPQLNDATTEMIIGANPDTVSNSLTGVVSLTRFFNRPLTDAEIFENFITTIPPQAVIDEINIA